MTQKTTAIFGIAVMAAILLGGLTFSQSAFAGVSTGGGPGGGQNKVTLCHVDQETGEEITITVGAPAVPAHLKHGDTLGACVDEPPTEPDCSVSPNPLEMTFFSFEPQTHTTSVGCINDQPIGLGAFPVTTNCGEFGITINPPFPVASFINPDAYGVDFEFDVIPVEPFGPLVECIILWETNSVINGIQGHEQTLLITFSPV